MTSASIAIAIYFSRCISFAWFDLTSLLTVFCPEPEELVQPARQGETYVMPFSPQTGSQSLTEQEQSELQAVNTEGVS